MFANKTHSQSCKQSRSNEIFAASNLIVPLLQRFVDSLTNKNLNVNAILNNNGIKLSNALLSNNRLIYFIIDAYLND